MRQKSIITIIFSILLLINFACSEKTSNSNLEKFSSVTITDSLEREIQFTEPPQRIVAFDSAAVEILFSIGEEKRIVGTHDFVTFPPETASIPKVGDAFNMNLESVIELNPDLVFVFTASHVEDLEKAGLKVLYIESRQSGLQNISQDILLKIIQLNISIRNKILKESHLTNNAVSKILVKLISYEISLINSNN